MVLHKECNIRATFTDLSKAFGTLNYKLFLAKLNTYGFSANVKAYIKSYLSNRYQRTNINNKFSTWKTINKGEPPVSVLGYLLFKVFINDMLYFIENCYLCNYADDSTLYEFDCNINIFKEKLYKDFEALGTWFYENYLALKTG